MADIAIAAIHPVAAYALNIAFSDGHDRGIFPWAFLRELAGQQAHLDPFPPAAAVAADQTHGTIR